MTVGPPLSAALRLAAWSGQALIRFALTVLALDLFVFSLLDVLPNASLTRLGIFAIDPDRLQATNERLGLDGPWYERFFGYWAHVVQGDFGLSLVGGFPVGPVMVQRVVNSVPLYAGSAVILVGALTTSIFAARVYRPPLEFHRFAVVPFVLLPQFVLAATLAALGRWVGVDLSGSSLSGLVLASIACASLPAAVLWTTSCEAFRQLSQASFVDTYVSLGLSEWQIRWRLIRNAALALRPLVGRVVLWTLTGSILVEAIFDRTGFGRLMLEGLRSSDIPVIRGWMLVAGAVVTALSSFERSNEASRLRVYPGGA